MLSNLRPETRYQVWLQAYLRNGKVIESNVLEVATNNRAVGIGGGGERVFIVIEWPCFKVSLNHLGCFYYKVVMQEGT